MFGYHRFILAQALRIADSRLPVQPTLLLRSEPRECLGEEFLLAVPDSDQRKICWSLAASVHSDGLEQENQGVLVSSRFACSASVDQPADQATRHRPDEQEFGPRGEGETRIPASYRFFRRLRDLALPFFSFLG